MERARDWILNYSRPWPKARVMEAVSLGLVAVANLVMPY